MRFSIASRTLVSLPVTSVIEVNKPRVSVMPHCARCGTNVHPFSFRSFSKITGRCNKCDSELERAVIRFIDAFREFAADGVLTRAEWKQLEELVASENLDMSEALHYASPDVTELIRKGLEVATSDEVITEHEEKYFDFLLHILTVPEPLVDEVRSTIAEYKAAQEIKKGNLPTVRSSVDWPSQICHLEVPAIYINTDTKTYPKRYGTLWATNSRLIFVSAERDFDLEWRKVRSVTRDGNTLGLEMSIKKGNGLYVVDRPILVEAIISRLVEDSRTAESTRVPPREKQKRDRGTKDAGAPYSGQQKSKTPYEILDLPQHADVESIKLAYRKMVKLYHPDKVATLAPEFQELAEVRMKEINAAYHELLR